MDDEADMEININDDQQDQTSIEEKTELEVTRPLA